MTETAGLRNKTQNIGLILGPIIFAILMFSDLVPNNPAATRTAALAALAATWWITEAIPLAATALIPLILFPLLGVMSGKSVAVQYFNSTIFLFVGGFLIAGAMEKCNLHKRIALRIIRIIGVSPTGIIFGFMAASAFLSAFISNTATAVMMLPIAIAVISKAEAVSGEKDSKKFATGLMLGIAYAASVGGVSTLVGTPPNLVFHRIFEMSFPDAPEISFGLWTIFALPLTLVMLAVIWILLTKIFFKSNKTIIDKHTIDDEYKALGKMSSDEKSVMIIFVLTAVLWMFRNDLNIGAFHLPGWSNLLSSPKLIDDGTVAIFMSMLLFFIPSKNKGQMILGKDAFGRLPWGIIILFGGGFALAAGFSESGLSESLGKMLSGAADNPLLVTIASVSAGLTFLTEMTSNTATTQTILPILASVSKATGINPLLLMIPATISASFAFMLPVATPPNAIIFGSGKVRIADMVKVGIVLNLIGIIVTTVLFLTWGRFVFGI